MLLQNLFSYSIFCVTYIGTMIKLFKVKEKQKELAETAAGEPPVKKQTAGHLRLIRGLFLH